MSLIFDAIVVGGGDVLIAVTIVIVPVAFGPIVNSKIYAEGGTLLYDRLGLN